MKKVCKYIIFILICLCTIPCVAKAWVFEGNYYRQSAGTLTAGNSYYSTYFSGWNYAHCENSSGGPFQLCMKGLLLMVVCTLRQIVLFLKTILMSMLHVQFIRILILVVHFTLNIKMENIIVISEFM